MSEYLDEAVWRENYRDFAGAVRIIREAVEESFGPLVPLPNSERTAANIEDCRHIAQEIVVYSEKTKRRIAELEEQISLTSRVDIEGVTEDAQPLSWTRTMAS